MNKYLSGMISAIIIVATIVGCKKEINDSDNPPVMNSEEIKAEIVRLENLHVKAILKKDSATLALIMDPALLVNNPRSWRNILKEKADR
jgi:hypothetical protein